MKRTVSILLASALLLSLVSCGPKGESSDPQGSQSSSQSQAQAVFTTLKDPTFPQFPQAPEDGPDADWPAYYNAYDEYYSAVMELRVGGIPEGTRFAVSDFAAKSTPLALAGQEGKNAAFSPVSLWAALAMLASPTTVSSFVMARSMGHEGTLTASTVMLTTFFSILTLTLWLYLLRTLGLI